MGISFFFSAFFFFFFSRESLVDLSWRPISWHPKAVSLNVLQWRDSFSAITPDNEREALQIWNLRSLERLCNPRRVWVITLDSGLKHIHHHERCLGLVGLPGSYTSQWILWNPDVSRTSSRTPLEIQTLWVILCYTYMQYFSRIFLFRDQQSHY